jgi:hypothetical protein
VVRETVEHGCRHFGVAENLGPVGKGEVRRDEDRGVLVELADEVEEELAAGLAEWQVAEFVDHDEIVSGERLGEPAAAAGGLFRLELVDEVDEIEEATACSGADDGGGDRNDKMRFARAGRSSVILPGVRRLRFGSSIRFTRAAARRLSSLAPSATPAPSTSSSASRIARWRCCRPG